MPPYTLHGYNLNPNAVWGAATPPVAYGSLSTGASGTTPPTMTAPTPPGSDNSSKPRGVNLTFTLPAEAKLFVDGRLTPGTGTERAFHTPPLAPGKYFYDVKAELVINGKTITEEKRVVVESGVNLSESFPKLLAAASQTNTIAGK